MTAHSLQGQSRGGELERDRGLLFLLGSSRGDLAVGATRESFAEGRGFAGRVVVEVIVEHTEFEQSDECLGRGIVDAEQEGGLPGHMATSLMDCFSLSTFLRNLILVLRGVLVYLWRRLRRFLLPNCPINDINQVKVSNKSSYNLARLIKIIR